MAELVHNCPRCGANDITFDVLSAVFRYEEYSWKKTYEVFCKCRRCLKPTIFIVSTKSYEFSKLFSNKFPVDLNAALNNVIDVDGYVSTKDNSAEKPPEFLPDIIEKVYREAATCVAVGCWNAAGTMFRATIDLATRPLLPAETDPASPNRRIRRDLGLRLPWLFDSKLLPEDLRDLSTCIREDGNDGAHECTLDATDAADLRDFTHALLERLYTFPERLRRAQKRRDDRRGKVDE